MPGAEPRVMERDKALAISWVLVQWRFKGDDVLMGGGTMS